MRRIQKILQKSYPDNLFWLSFVLLNCLLFVPFTAFYWNQTSFWPTRSEMAFSWVDIGEALFLQRENLDIFRLNLEWLLLIAPWVFSKRFRHWLYALLVASFYLFQLLYATYEGFIRSYYLLDPTLFNDYLLFHDMTGYVLNNLQISWGLYGLAALLIIALLAFLFWAVRTLLLRLPAERLSWVTRLGMLVLVMVVLLVWVKEGTALAEPQTAVHSLTYKLWGNNGRSRLAAAKADRFTPENVATTYAFTSSQLQQRPNIYLIFVESYGSVLTKRRDFNARYQSVQNKLQAQLETAGWHIASSRSEAPTWGGASWVSYTSALIGARLESHAEYLALLHQYRDTPFPHLLNYLNDQGYYTLRLSAISRELDDAQLAEYKQFYGFDDWLRFSDLDYQGPLYGWGPAIPDQYALHYAHDFMNRVSDAPHLFFYISQNSHYPWFPLPEVADDWHSINELPPAPPTPIQRVEHELLRQRYLDAIVYQLDAYTHFILTEGGENDIFVLMGDHQPARVASRRDGWDTQFHIISKNQAFIESFADYAFTLQFATSGTATTLHHEGFYSLFMRQLLAHFGEKDAVLPDFQPTGFSFGTN